MWNQRLNPEHSVRRHIFHVELQTLQEFGLPAVAGQTGAHTLHLASFSDAVMALRGATFW